MISQAPDSPAQRAPAGQASIGLDFGTSAMRVASPTGIVPIGRELPWLASVVGFAASGTVVAGEAAEQAPTRVRLLKQQITDRHKHVRVELRAGPKSVRVDDLIVELLREVARRLAARGYCIEAGTSVALGCPAAWDRLQRRRLATVAQRAGLPVTISRLLDEPVAAGLAWLAGEQRIDVGPPLYLLVVDMGEAMVDIAVLDVRGDDSRDVTVLSTLGVAEPGSALDEAIAADLDMDLVRSGLDLDSLPDPALARAWLRFQATTAKLGLTLYMRHPVKMSRHVTGRLGGGLSYSRERLRAAFAPQLQRIEAAIDAALRLARTATGPGGQRLRELPPDRLSQAVDVVLLSGGASRVPCVRERLQGLFGRSRVEPATATPEEAVAIGLAHLSKFRLR